MPRGYPATIQRGSRVAPAPVTGACRGHNCGRGGWCDISQEEPNRGAAVLVGAHTAVPTMKRGNLLCKSPKVRNRGAIPT